ncbi:MAG: sugar phosphate isomerase/epimerase family protein [Puniceicoccales bacterium]
MDQQDKTSLSSTARDRAYPLKWAFSSMGMPEANLDTLLSVGEKWGIEELELRTLEDSIDLPAVLQQRFSSPEGFREYTENHPAVKISVLSGSLRLAQNTGKDRSDFLDYVPWAEAAGVQWLRAFDFVGPYEPWSDEMFASAVETLRWWKEEKSRNGWRVEILVEGHHRLFFPEMYRRVAEEIGWEPALLYDLGHALRNLEHEGSVAAYRELALHIPRVHIKDPAVPVPGGLKHCVPGEGTADIKAFLSLFAGQDSPPVVTLEWEKQWEKRLPDMEVALQALRDRKWL